MCNPAVAFAALFAVKTAAELQAQRDATQFENSARRQNYEQAKQISERDLRSQYVAENRRMQEEATAASIEQQRIDRDLNMVIAEAYVEDDAGEAISAQYLMQNYLDSYSGFTDAATAQHQINTRAKHGRERTAQRAASHRALSAWKPQLPLLSQGMTWLSILASAGEGYVMGSTMGGGTDVAAGTPGAATAGGTGAAGSTATAGGGTIAGSSSIAQTTFRESLKFQPNFFDTSRLYIA